MHFEWVNFTVCEFSSVAQLCLTLCNPMDCSTCPSPIPGVYSNSCPLSQWCQPTISSSVISFSSCLQSFPAPGSDESDQVKWVNSSHQVANILELQLQHQSFQRIFRVDLLSDWIVLSLCSPRDSQGSFPTPQFKSISSSVLNLLYGPTLTSVHDYWKSHSFDYMGFVAKWCFYFLIHCLYFS